MGFADNWMDETPLILRNVREQAHGDTGIYLHGRIRQASYGIWKMHAVLAFCSAVIAFPFPLALPFGEVFDSDDGAMAAGALVGLSGCNFFGKLDFNKFSN